jgi:hypothetical protein
MPNLPSQSTLTPEEFAILPWGWTPPDPAALEGIRQCGFNLAGFVSPDGLDLAAEAGLKAIVSDESTHVTDAAAGWNEAEISQRVQALVKRVKGHPALYGYYLRDEPAAGIYPGLARWAAAFHAADPGAAAYINLFPNYATAGQMGVETYPDYVQTYLETVSPPFLSYDHYALMEDGGLRSEYFENLEVIRSAALRRGIPFWNIVLSNTHFDYAEPSPAGLRFQVYTTLAYGARGISYFTYFAPDVGNFRSAPVDQFGNRTPTWEMLRQVNLQIHRLGPTYLPLKSVHVFHTLEIPFETQTIDTSRFMQNVEGGAFVVGEFEGPGGQPHILVVNKSLQHSARFTVQFKEKGPVLRTSPFSGQTSVMGGEDNWLAPGGGALLALG